MFQCWEPTNTHPTLGQLVQNQYPVFNDWWSTYVPEYKEVLIEKIQRAYWFNEICAETPDRFSFYINSHLQRIMPYYNQLYQSELIKVNPMLNHSMAVSGRTIENLIKKANSSDDKFSKAIREFSGITDHSDVGQTHSESTTKANRVDDETSGYNKSGTDDKTEHTISDEDSTKTVKRTEDEITDSGEKSKETVKVDGTTTTDGTVTDTIDEQIKKTTDYGQTTTSNTTEGTGSTSSGSGTKKWTEVTDDDSTTDTDTHLTEKTVTDSEQDYADTPQKRLPVDNVNGTAVVRKDYLTNVTWNDSTTSHTADTTQNVVFKDDQTKTHTEDTSDTSETNSQTKSETKTDQGGADTETTDKDGNNVKTTDMNETVDSTTTKDGSVDLDKSVNTTEDISEVEHTDTDSTTTTDDDWTEKGTGNGKLNSVTNSNTVADQNSANQGVSNSRETSDNTASSSSVGSSSEDSTRDTGESQITEGFMNVSSSALLEAFRRTFLNIDQMIIDELRNNFMLVY